MRELRSRDTESLREELIRRHTALVEELRLQHAALGAVLIEARQIPRPRGSNTVFTELERNIGKVVPLPAPSNQLVLPLGRIDFGLYLRIDDAAADVDEEAPHPSRPSQPVPPRPGKPGPPSLAAPSTQTLADRVEEEYGYGATEARRRYDAIVQALTDHADSDPPVAVFLLPVDGEPLPPYRDPRLSDPRLGRFETGRPPFGHWMKLARQEAKRLKVSLDALGSLQGRRSPRHQALKEARLTIALHLEERGALNVEIAKVFGITPSAVSRMLAGAWEKRALDLKHAAEEKTKLVADDIRRELEGGTDGK